jgi:DNA helicase IV
MQSERKSELHSRAKEHVIKIREKIKDAVLAMEVKNSTMTKESMRMYSGDALAASKILAISQERVENLKQLYPSPYFNFCEFIINGEKKNFYFSKFSFNEENIYSWITPAASLRFEKPGSASYFRPDGNKQEGQLSRKDQYTIVDGK